MRGKEAVKCDDEKDRGGVVNSRQEQLAELSGSKKGNTRFPSGGSEGFIRGLLGGTEDRHCRRDNNDRWTRGSAIQLSSQLRFRRPSRLTVCRYLNSDKDNLLRSMRSLYILMQKLDPDNGRALFG